MEYINGLCTSLYGVSYPLDVTDSSTIDSSSSSGDEEEGDEGYRQNSVRTALATEGWYDRCCLEINRITR